MGRGSCKPNVLEAKYEAKVVLPGGRRWAAKPKNIPCVCVCVCVGGGGGGMDIFWNCTMNE